MLIWNGFKLAFSMYSKIWMPKTEWTKDNMKFVLCFFPCIGFVIGMIQIAWFLIAETFQIGILLYAVVAACIPIIMSGGIHMDGLMDTSDALHSYQSKDQKLEILKDPHTGAFAILCCCMYLLLSVALFSEMDKQLIMFMPGIFTLSRACSGLSVATFKMAKDTGLAAAFQNAAHKKIVAITMIGYIVLCVCSMLYMHVVYGIIILLAASIMFAYYHHMAMQQFDGITGDIAGYFLQWCEVAMLAAMMIGYFIM